MRVNLNWLREWVDLDGDGQQIADELTVAGLEVDAIDDAAPALGSIVVAEVQRVDPHPDADRLSLCTVFDGERQLDVVCGAPNVRQGMRVPFAPVGAVLPGGQKIKAAKIRGQRSEGMLCSARELGLSDDAAGLMALDPDAVPGTPLESHLQLPDAVIEVDLTPNRGDCFSVIGLARELAARRGKPLTGPPLESVAAMTASKWNAVLDAPADCPRFCTRVVEGLDTSARTPDWMRERLRRAGMRPISPVVDVTNYVMWELGQPLHAYSAASLAGDLRARRAHAGETLTLLDDTTIELAADVLVIADDSGAIGLAGIMGGKSTAIDAATADVVLESAFFAQRAIQGRARRFGLHTDASVRFERGVDPSGQARAIERATALLVEIAGGRPGPILSSDAPDHLPRRETIALRHARIEAVLGASVPSGHVVDWLERLGMAIDSAADGWRVTPPPHRFDLSIEEDLIEEIGRMMGYDSIEAVPGTVSAGLGEAPESRVDSDEMADLLVARGYDEIISYSFIDPAANEAVAAGENRAAPVLANPLSQELSVMRGSLWPGLIRAAQQNLSRQRGRCRLFETGTVFRVDRAGAVVESQVVAGLAVGGLEPEHWSGPARDVDFFDVKSDVAALLQSAGRFDEVDWRAVEHRSLSPASATVISIGDKHIGYIGELHPALDRIFDIRKGAIVFEIDIDLAFEALVPAYRPVSKFPHVRRDIAVLVDETVNAGDLTKLVAGELGDRLYRTVVFDEYRGKTLESGRKSIGLGLILQDVSRTLTDTDADEMLAAAVKRLEHELGATIRT